MKGRILFSCAIHWEPCLKEDKNDEDVCSVSNNLQIDKEFPEVDEKKKIHLDPGHLGILAQTESITRFAGYCFNQSSRKSWRNLGGSSSSSALVSISSG